MAGLNPEELKKVEKMLKKQADLHRLSNASMAEYVGHLKTIGELQSNIKHTQEVLNKMESDRIAMQEELAKLTLRSVNNGGKETDEIKKQRKALREKIATKKIDIGLTKEGLKYLKETNDEYVEQAKNVNKLNLGLKEGVKLLAKTPGLLKKGYGKLKSYGLFETDKAIRMAGVEMGMLADVGSAFGKDLIKAQKTTFSMGMGVKDLAKVQATYSSELGRSVMLSEEGFDAISQIAKGTVLGSEGASRLVANMDRFNISAEQTGAIIDETTKMAAKMGLNAGKVIKTLEHNLKLANKYHFKGGVKGMIKMAAQATKFHMSMETTAQFADKLFNIEGAVEMAARLNTMGGEWAKLGDPMKLMFQARNDMEGLQTSVINATAGMADFNKETGEFSFSGLELHRMKELEKITGISAEQMAEMAKSKARFAKISGQMGFEVGGDPAMKDFIENSAVFNKDTKQFEIKLSGIKKAIPVKELDATFKKHMKKDAASLKERAEKSQSFDEQITNMIESAKTLLLPLLEGLNNEIPSMIDGFKKLMGSGIVASIVDGIRSVGKMIGETIKFLIEFPQLIAAGMIGVGLFKLGMWFLNGVRLGMGFNSVARAGMAGAAGGGGASKLFNTKRTGAGMSKMGKASMNFKGAAGSAGAIGGGVLAAGMSGYNEWTENKEAGMDSGENAARTAIRGGGAGLGALGGAAAGAAIGSVVPIIGTLIGGILGGALGAWGGDALGNVAGDAIMDDGIIFNPKDKFLSVDDTAIIAGTKEGGNADMAKAITGGGSTSNSVDIKISFDTLKIEGDNGEVTNYDFINDTEKIRELATGIVKSITTTANGGKLNPNTPVVIG